MSNDFSAFDLRENAQEFDYGAVDREEKEAHYTQVGADFLSTIFTFISMSGEPKTRALRMEVMLFEVRPDLSPYTSYESLAKGLGQGVSKQYVHKIAKKFREYTGFRSHNEFEKKSEAKKKR